MWSAPEALPRELKGEEPGTILSDQKLESRLFYSADQAQSHIQSVVNHIDKIPLFSSKSSGLLLRNPNPFFLKDTRQTSVYPVCFYNFSI